MRNWSVDEKYMNKKSPESYKIWKLEQQISYGLDTGEKIKRSDMIKYWPILSNRLDPARREFVKFILWS